MNSVKKDKKHKNVRSKFLVVKRSGYHKGGRLLSATDAAKEILQVGFWPLFFRSPCRRMVKPGHSILIYLAGGESDCQAVIASAVVKDVIDWDAKVHARLYPLMLDGQPETVMNLVDITFFPEPVLIKSKLSQLDLVPKQNPSKWGAMLVGGMKSLTENDYSVLSGAGI